MCPLRFILVFFSAILAGYFAWRSLRDSPEVNLSSLADDSVQDKQLDSSNDEKQEGKTKRMIQDGFWIFVDMASGKYLWRNFKEMNKNKNKARPAKIKS